MHQTTDIRQRNDLDKYSLLQIFNRPRYCKVSVVPRPIQTPRTKTLSEGTSKLADLLAHGYSIQLHRIDTATKGKSIVQHPLGNDNEDVDIKIPEIGLTGYRMGNHRSRTQQPQLVPIGSPRNLDPSIPRINQKRRPPSPSPIHSCLLARAVTSRRQLNPDESTFPLTERRQNPALHSVTVVPPTIKEAVILPSPRAGAVPAAPVPPQYARRQNSAPMRRRPAAQLLAVELPSPSAERPPFDAGIPRPSTAYAVLSPGSATAPSRDVAAPAIATEERIGGGGLSTPGLWRDWTFRSSTVSAASAAPHVGRETPRRFPYAGSPGLSVWEARRQPLRPMSRPAVAVAAQAPAPGSRLAPRPMPGPRRRLHSRPQSRRVPRPRAP